MTEQQLKKSYNDYQDCKNLGVKPAGVTLAEVQEAGGLRKSVKGRGLLIGGAGAAALVLALVIMLAVSALSAPAAITVNGQQVAAVKSEAVAQEIIEAYLAEQGEAIGNKVYYVEQVAAAPRAEAGSKKQSRSEAKAALAAAVQLETHGAVILVEGEPLVYTASVALAQQTLDNLQLTYMPEDETLQVLEVKFEQQVEIRPVDVAVADVKNLDEAKLALKTPGEDGSVPVTVLAVLEKTREEEIPYQTVFETDTSLRYGQTQLKQAGVNGNRQVTLQIAQANGVEIARQEISSNTLLEPVDEIMLEGAVVRTASRAVTYAGSGGMIWPTTATRISSYYGARSDDNHTGIDIDGEFDDPVWAAKSGTVVSAGYHGSYGNEVVISHGDGLQTRYAHLNSISVSEGDEVEIGQQVGLEGSTGNSTGSHLHFEVIVDGQTVDPLGYLN